MRLIAIAAFLVAVLSCPLAWSQRVDPANAQREYWRLVNSGDAKAAIPFAKILVEAESRDKKSLRYGVALGLLANVHRASGSYGEAEALFKQAIEILERAPEAKQEELGFALSRLGQVYDEQGRYREAEQVFRRALTILETVKSPERLRARGHLAHMYRASGQLALAETFYTQLLSEQQSTLGKDTLDVALTLNNLGVVYFRLAQYDKAEPLYEQALDIRKRKLGPDHPEVAYSLNQLGALYRETRRPEAALTALRQAVAIETKGNRRGHPNSAFLLTALANTYMSVGDHANAKPLYAEALTLRQRTLRSDHPEIAVSLNNLARLNAATDNVSDAIKFSRGAVRVAIGTMSGDLATGSRTDVSVLRRYFDQNLALLRRAGNDRALGIDVTADSFETAQWINQSMAATALTQVAARFAAGSDGLAAIVREQQDAAGKRRALDRRLLAELAKSPNQRDSKLEAALRQEIRELDGSIQRLNARIVAEFPKYADLLSPKPLQTADVQRLVGANEAMLLFHVSELGSYVWAITRERAEWREIKLKPAELDSQVKKLRDALDPGAVKGAEARESTLFDLNAAHALYGAVLGPVADVVAGKPHLIVIPSGALTSLPYHVLVTEKPSRPIKTVADYRSAAWLARKHAVTVLPSIASLKILRTASGRPAAPQAYLGFGDPIFDASRGRPSGDPSRLLVTTGSSGTTRSAHFDFDRLKTLKISALPNTAVELDVVARAFGAPQSHVKLRQDASERTVKSLKLDDYRILHFATHALKVDDPAARAIDLREPALVMTLPAVSSVDDDGLLTSSEIAELKLNADWVILSACNTAAGDKPGAEDLSGLARAFFYAGARTLMVSHWEVYDDAGAALITRAVQALEKNRTQTPAEVLRLSMLALMDDTTVPTNAHPSQWAPFVIVGTLPLR